MTYRRGSEKVVGLLAVRSVQTVDITDAAGAVIEATRVDWILTEALVIAGAATQPQDGDQIEWTAPSGAKEVYEAMPSGSDSCCAESGAGWRVHTRLVGKS